MNVILIITDTLRIDNTGAYGNEWIRTPNFDRLASEGTLFRRAYTEGLPTVPARTAYFTGRYTLFERGWQHLKLDDVLLAEILWDKGFLSAFITDTYHLHKPKMGFSRGFEKIRRARGGFVTFVDKCVGRLISWLRESDFLKRTLIIWVSDHGDFFGEHGIIQKFRPWPYDILSHVPLVIRHPSAGHGRVIDAFVQSVDLMPTILEFMDVSIPETVQGKSLIPLLEGKVEKLRHFAIAGYYNSSWSIRDEEWSFYLWLGERSALEGMNRTGGPELYNLLKDPGEESNVIKEHPDVAKKLSSNLQNFMAL